MAKFKYSASDKFDEVHEGELEAADQPAAIALLTERAWQPIMIAELEEKKKRGLSFLDSLASNKIKADDLVMFTRQLSAMVGAGVPLLRALNSLGSYAKSSALKKILEEVYKDIQSGTSLAEALEKHPSAFNDVYTNMVRAGEAAGILDEILKRLAAQQEKSATLRKKIKSAMTYPTVLVVIAVGAFFGLMIFVIPQIGNIIKDLGGPDAELPAITKMMLGVSDFMIKFWYILIPGLVGLVFIIIKYIKTTTGRKVFHRLLLKMPGVNQLITKIAIARFTRTFSALIGAGVAVLEALKVTGDAVGNTVFEEAIAEAAKEVEQGKLLSQAIEKNILFPPIVSQMLAVGEETGQTDIILVKVADFYEEEVDVAIEGLSSIIEPVMIVLMGGMVGLIAASVMQPIAGLSQQIK